VPAEAEHIAALLFDARADLAVADNRSRGFLVGPAFRPAGLDLRLIRVVLEHDGGVGATTAGAAPGHLVAATTDRVGSVEIGCE
jgi:hypothetical protein